MTPVLIDLFDGVASPPEADVVVTMNSTPMQVQASFTNANAWETTHGLAEGDVLAVTISDGVQAGDLAPMVIPAAPISMLPMRELTHISIVLTAGGALWAASRTARAWRRPAVRTTEAVRPI